jgi:hypothetical protein
MFPRSPFRCARFCAGQIGPAAQGKRNPGGTFVMTAFSRLKDDRSIHHKWKGLDPSGNK